LGVGHPTLSRIVHITEEISKTHHRSYHAKLTGAGGGGCAIILLEDTVEEAEGILMEQLK
jgi:mevalonate kinase